MNDAAFIQNPKSQIPRSYVVPALIVILSVVYKLFLLALQCGAVQRRRSHRRVDGAPHLARRAPRLFLRASLSWRDRCVAGGAVILDLWRDRCWRFASSTSCCLPAWCSRRICWRRRYLQNEWGARAAMLWMALPPTMLTLYTTATLGGYTETLAVWQSSVVDGRRPLVVGRSLAGRALAAVRHHRWLCVLHFPADFDLPHPDRVAGCSIGCA